ncbi:MAG: hypothetical protein KKF44_06510 [Nanoarchaeota archaeon]|nr:hypothetical protein [Nanoarchaeota archaeon]
MLNHKKGVSPLVSTLLLVLIVIAVGATVMFVLKNLTLNTLEEEAEPTDDAEFNCDDVDVGILKISGKHQICHNTETNTLDAAISNRGNSDIADFKFIAIGNAKINNINSVGYGLKAGDNEYFYFSCSQDIGELIHIKITPIINRENSEEKLICFNKEITLLADDIKEC